MNNILKSDNTCHQRNLQLKTYSVIPMTKDLGAIEWVNNTVPMKEILDKQISIATNKKEQSCNFHGISVIKWFSDSFVKKSDNNNHVIYMKMFEKAPREKIIEKMKELWTQIPKDLLIKGLQSLCSTNEAYFTIRNRFTRSISTVNLCSYILGIGDRHLENVLIDKSDGSIVPIDFGHAFGSATEILPVPEIVPFRMTRQITSLMGPLYQRNEESIFSKSMTHCLIALRKQKELLLNIMDVFVREPLVEWMKYAKRFSHLQPKDTITIHSDSSEFETDPIEPEHIWYPKNKIKIAKRKLELANPVNIICEELKNNTSVQQVRKHIERIIVGDVKNGDFRASVGRVCSSEKQQVDCLIDLATDPNVLGRMWVGWSSWI
jgi:DNA-dependent protein kinase catalytic subunit